MDKKQFSVIFAQVYQSLTPKKVSFFKKNEDIFEVRVVSDSFAEMSFTTRFELLNKLLEEQQPAFFKQYLFIFEAFTVAEANNLPKSEQADPDESEKDFKQSASSL
jgi:CRISPR/Cas system CSM-associated protein Csm5 (group 7 of RAMP superfamily)